MYKLIISLFFVVTLAVPAFSDEYDSYSADWKGTRQMSQGKQPKFFAYVDRLPAGATPDERQEQAKRVDQSWVDRRYWCDSKNKINSAHNVAVYKELSAGKHFFVIECLRACKNIKYSIASGSDSIVIFHSGLSEEFPQLSVPGPPSYFHQTNIGFIFFDDGEGSSPNRVQRRSGRPTLSSDTEIVIKHWKPHWLSSFGGNDCE